MNFNFNLSFENMMHSNQLDTVVILAHMNPDGDAAGSVMGLAHYIRDVYPMFKVIPYLSEKIDKGPKKLVDDDREFVPFVKPDFATLGNYAVIVCDTATRARIIGFDLFEHASADMVLDHHAGNEGYGTVNYTKISEACAENLFYLLDWNEWMRAMEEHPDSIGANPNAADYIYLGILHDTGGFVRAQKTTMEAAAKLIGMGVIHSYIMKTMQNDTLESLKKRAVLLSFAKKAVNNKVAYLMLTKDESDVHGIEYEDIHPISGFLRDCEDVELGFTMFEEEANVWRCSFRSNGKWINVNELLQPFGGGGHAAAAGLRKKTDDPKRLLQDILQRIDKIRHGMQQLECMAQEDSGHNAV